MPQKSILFLLLGSLVSASIALVLFTLVYGMKCEAPYFGFLGCTKFGFLLDFGSMAMAMLAGGFILKIGKLNNSFLIAFSAGISALFVQLNMALIVPQWRVLYLVFANVLFYFAAFALFNLTTLKKVQKVLIAFGVTVLLMGLYLMLFSQTLGFI